VERVAPDPDGGARRRGPGPALGSGRGPLDRLPASAGEPFSESPSSPTTSRTAPSTSTTSSGRSSATGTWRSSSRGSTTATRTPRRPCSGRSSRCSRSRIR
jgi:hypothetical protein